MMHSKLFQVLNVFSHNLSTRRQLCCTLLYVRTGQRAVCAVCDGVWHTWFIWQCRSNVSEHIRQSRLTPIPDSRMPGLHQDPEGPGYCTWTCGPVMCRKQETGVHGSSSEWRVPTTEWRIYKHDSTLTVLHFLQHCTSRMSTVRFILTMPKTDAIFDNDSLLFKPIRRGRHFYI